MRDSRPYQRRSEFSLKEGHCILTFPMPVSEESARFFREWLELVVHVMECSAKNAEAEPEPEGEAA